MSSVGSNEIVEVETFEITMVHGAVVRGEQIPVGRNRKIKFRIFQLLFSTLAVILMAVNDDFTQVPAFCYFLAANGVLATWSFCRAAVEGFAKARNINLNSGRLFLIFAVGDQIVSFAAFTSACGSTAILGVPAFDIQDTSTSNYSKFACATLMGFIAALLMLSTVQSLYNL